MPNNPFFVGGGVPNVMQLLQQLKQNPAQVLAQRFRLPQNVSNPNDLLQHLVQSGQVSQQQVNAAYQQAQRMGIRR